MNRKIWILALLVAPIAVPAAAERLAAYRNLGECVAAWSHYDNEYWEQTKAGGSEHDRGNGFSSGVICVQDGDLWYLVTAGR